VTPLCVYWLCDTDFYLEQAVKIKSSRGFSLIEVIVVLALVAVAASIAVPSLKAYRYNTNLKEAARDISSNISFYRQRAVAENVRFRINFDASENTYQIEKENPAGSGNYVNLHTLEPAVPDKLDVCAGNANIVILGTPSFSGGVPSVILNPRGTSGAGNLTLQNTNRLSTATITTNLMGRVKVEYVLK
jgi:prepilin-type N-terminal cleavage/methylation domain-containing protein